MAQMRAWTDERDGKRWLLVCRRAEHPTAVRLVFGSQGEQREVTVPSNIPLDDLTDQEIEVILDRAERNSALSWSLKSGKRP